MPGRSNTRITDSPEFDRVYRNGRAYRGKLFAVHAFPNGLETSRLGMSVSKKVGNAVIRNRVRRWLREIFHATLSDIPGSMDLVISARPQCSGASYEEFRSEFAVALDRLNRAGH